MSPARKLAVMAAAVVGVVGVSATVYAFWSKGGSGTASARTGDFTAAQNVTAVQPSAGVASVNVGWVPQPAPDGSSGNGFYIERLSGSAASPACGSSPAAPLAASASSCTDEGVAAGTYTYRVVALFRSWTAESAVSSNVKVIVDATAPSVTVTAPVPGGATKVAATVFTGAAGTNSAGSSDSGDLPAVTVRVYPGGSASGTPARTLTTDQNAGAWTVTASPALPDGQYTVTAAQSDNAGNTGTTAPVTFVVDTVAPAVTVTTPANGGATNDTTPTLSGTAGNTALSTSASADATAVAVKVYSGSGTAGALLQTLSATRSGTAWTIDATALAPAAQYTAVATQADGAGNLGTSSAVTFVLDTVAPLGVSITAPPAGGVTNDTTPTLTGTAGSAAASGTSSADAATLTIKVFPGGVATGTVLATLTPSRSSGSWTIDASALPADGQYTVTASQSDVAGNTTTSTPVAFTLDTVAPAVAIATPAASALTGDSTPTIAGTAGNATASTTSSADGATVTVKLFSGPVATGTPVRTLTATRTGTAWTVEPATALTPDGQYTATATQADAAGNTTTSTPVTFTLDTGAPTSLLATVADAGTGASGYIHQGGAYYVYGKASDGSGVGSMSATVSNLTASQLQTVALAGTGGPWTVGGTIYAFRSPALTATAVLTEGSKSYTVTATDTLGNTSGASGYTVTVDNTVPTTVSAVVADASANVAGFLHQGGGYYVYGNASDTGSGVNNLTANVGSITTGQTAVPMTAGTWTVANASGVPSSYTFRSGLLTANPGLAPGSVSFSATATDRAGNTTSPATSGSATVDNTGPTIISVNQDDYGKTSGTGKLQQRDAVIFTFSEAMDVTSFCDTTWTTVNANQVVNGPSVVVTVTNNYNGGNDRMTFSVNGVTCYLGALDMGSPDFVTADITFEGPSGNTSDSELNWNETAKTLTILFGLPSRTGVFGAVTTASSRYTPVAGATDRAGNPLPLTVINGTGRF